MTGYEVQKIENEVLAYWKKKKIYEKLVKKNKKGKIFYYLDGPPYTSGRIHIGHAWGKALRDSILRYKRLQGFNTWDQAGFDMHGLPIEVKVEKRLRIKDKTEILTKLGLKKFITECETFAKEQMKPMISDFERIGVWMNFKKPYMTIKDSYIEGVWWALKEADKNGYLYEGLKSMTWCPRCATALAKHELEYENVKENSIFVKFPTIINENEYLIVWTTTPWTIPFNMAVMANPELDYVKAKIKESNETWILAKALANVVISAVAGKEFEVIEEFKGSRLKGLRYIHPFYEEIDFHKKTMKRNDRAYRVVLSKEYVDTSAGSGLVHCAPGCGPEDFEIGKKNKLPAFNNLDEQGIFPKEMGVFEGLKAKKDDKAFTETLMKKGLLIAETEVEHEYAHCWRCKSPVIYRATDQWFLAVEKLKDEMIEKNKKIYWVPDWAGSRWFNSWLENLQDWCISRQRFWGIPLPIWKCSSCGKYIVIGSKDEIKKLAKEKIENLHRPWIDEVKIDCDCGDTMERVEDVLDVWLDSGAASWAPLEYPKNKKLVKKIWPPELILEGKDQIRGWFNSMMCLSMVSFKEAPYKAVYMHGFTNDALGRKMSKSLGNIISPYEVVDKYGADTLRYYMMGGAKPGIDINYNFEDVKLKNKNLLILWNIHNYIIDFCKTNKIKPKKIKGKIGIEERYILSKLNSTISKTTELFDTYKLNEISWGIEGLFLELSRTYMQLVREKSAVGSKKEKELVASVIYETLFDTLRLFTPIAPFICEKIYLNLKDEFKLKKESISLEGWAKVDKRRIDMQLEHQFEIVEPIIQEILSKREKVKLGIRWPFAKVEISLKEKKDVDAVKKLSEIIKTQTNVKKVIAKKSNRKSIKLDTKLTKELEAEGFTREVTRRIQALRKKAGLKKDDDIYLHIKCSGKLEECLCKFDKYIKEKCGASKLTISKETPEKRYKHESKEKVKEIEFDICFSKQ